MVAPVIWSERPLFELDCRACAYFSAGSEEISWNQRTSKKDKNIYPAAIIIPA
jgi:hypothetical protein